MISNILKALKALVKYIPWYKIASFLKWIAKFIAVVAKYIAKYGKIILNFIKKNPAKIVNWFLNGYSALDVIRQILKAFGIDI